MDMDIRHLINIVTEANLTVKELSKHNGAYVNTLIQQAKAGPVPLDPAISISSFDKYQGTVNGKVELAAETIAALEANLAAATPLPSAPMFILADGTKVQGTWGALYKGPAYAGPKGTKLYNSGHLAELFMGLSVSVKFTKLGETITDGEVIDFLRANTIEQHLTSKGSYTGNIRFNFNESIVYNNVHNKTDRLTFTAVIPGKSAGQLINQLESGRLNSDLLALLSSSVRYANESPSVASSINMVATDPNSNQIVITSDGTTDAKMTKADLIMSIDGRTINLFSLKTFGTKTYGQISGVGLSQVKAWFDTSFGIDITPMSHGIQQATTPQEGFQELLKLYDDSYDMIKNIVDNKSPETKSEIIQQFAAATKLHINGKNNEDIEVVKLDDKIKNGNYKILKVSDDLEDAMSKFDLYTQLTKSTNSRTLQIFVKPEEGVKVSRQSNKLCQFRSFKAGDSYRNYFEIGPMLEKLIQIGPESNTIDDNELTANNSIGPRDKPLGNKNTMGRTRRKH